MRIAINALGLGRRRNGIVTSTCGIIQILRLLGHQVIIYGNSELLPSGIGVDTSRTPPFFGFGNGSVTALLRLIWSHIVIPLNLIRDRINLLISPTVEGLLWCPCPQIVVVHDIIPFLFRKEAPTHAIYYRCVLPAILRCSTRIVAVSEHTRTDLLREYRLSPDKVDVVYNAVHRSMDQTSSDKKPAALAVDRYFLYVGCFAPRKNLETVARAFAKVHSRVAESLVLVGYPDKWFPGILMLIDKLHLSHRFIVLSGLTESEISYLYRNASALFLLSEYEGFGYPLLEAMVAGTPAVVSETTALGEVAGKGALLLKPHDVDAAAMAMLRLSTDQEYRSRLGAAGAERAQNFAWSQTQKQWDHVLSACLSPP